MESEPTKTATPTYSQARVERVVQAFREAWQEPITPEELAEAQRKLDAQPAQEPHSVIHTGVVWFSRRSAKMRTQEIPPHPSAPSECD